MSAAEVETSHPQSHTHVHDGARKNQNGQAGGRAIRAQVDLRPAAAKATVGEEFIVAADALPRPRPGVVHSQRRSPHEERHHHGPTESSSPNGDATVQPQNPS